jgi:alkanesulfonate monooxygenase SsuD/methylene tetrahydromethanopterin reductase-like flavin-dependent oxidoreductase (luciferase family)
VRNVQFGLCGLTAESTDLSPAGYGDALHRLIDFAVLAEEVGFDSVWLSEHHFATDGYLPSPWAVLGMLAARTERVVIGTSVLLAPLHDPVRLAEEAAIADHLSAGRLVLGMGLGYRAEEFRGFNLEPSQRVRALLNCIETCKRAWRGDTLAGLGLLPEDWEVVIRPLPASESGPPIWVGSAIEAGVRRAATVADGYIAPPIPLRYFDRCMSWLADAGSLENLAVMTSVYGFTAAENAREVARPGVSHVDEQYRHWLAMEAATAAPTANTWAAEQKSLLDGPQFVVGNPDECVEQLRPWYQALANLPGDAPAHLTIRLTWPAMGPELEEAIRLFGTEVIPRLRSEVPA